MRLTPEQFKAIEARRSPNKFGAKRAEVDGYGFASKHEAERYLMLKAEQLSGQIKQLRMQIPLQVHINGQHVFTYIADFCYIRDSFERFEDAKGYRKGSAYQLFRLKKAVIKAALGIDIEEV